MSRYEHQSPASWPYIIGLVGVVIVATLAILS